MPTSNRSEAAKTVVFPRCNSLLMFKMYLYCMHLVDKFFFKPTFTTVC